MSTLRLTTISNQSGSATVPSETVINGSAKAWVNFNGTGTVAIRRAFNVSSITDNGAGDFTINLTTAMSDANYAVVAMAGAFALGNAPIGFYETTATAKTTSLIRLFTSQGGTGVDGSSESVVIFS